HLPEAMVMSVGLAVGSDVHELRPGAGVGKSAQQTVGEGLAVVEQAFERDCLRYRPVIEEEIDIALRRQLHPVSARWIDLTLNVLPRAPGEFLHSSRLPRRQDGEADAQVGQYLQRL